MDERLRELERRYAASPDDAEQLEELRRAYAQRGERLPPSILRLTPRWRPLVEFVQTWYERPLSDDDGCAVAELDAAEARLGAKLPGALWEWHRLVGKRLQAVLDAPARLQDSGLDGWGPDDPFRGLLPVWFENQAVWRAGVPVGGDEDPRVQVHMDPNEEPSDIGPLVESLRQFVISDTLQGALWRDPARPWARHQRRGPLGPLAGSVEAGIDPLASDALVEALVGAYPVIEPHLGCRGDGSTLIRFVSRTFHWMTATETARGALGRFLGAEHPWHCEVQVLVDGPGPAAPVRGFVSGVGEIDRRDLHGYTMIRLATVDPEGAFAWIRAALGETTMDRVRASYERGQGHARTTTYLWPPELVAERNSTDRQR